MGARGVRPRPIEERFWAKVLKTSGCWQWLGRPTKAGYGQLEIRRPDGSRGVLLAHRLSWEMHFGTVPDGMCICHHCDNPPCTNPDHLFLGTHADNMEDMRAKGRNFIPAGELGPAARLTASDIQEMRQRFRIGAGRGAAAAAETYGISQSHAHRILSGEKWRCVS